MGLTLVVGLARSGLWAANLLAAEGREVTVTDAKPASQLSAYTERLSPSVHLALGGHPTRLFEEAELIVLSPGVPADIEPLRHARSAGIRIISELELAYNKLKGLPVYAVTGTNGKSTTVTLLDECLKSEGKKTILAGNIGNALSEEVLKRVNGEFRPSGVDCAVVEVSSFQLEAIERFRAAGAAILNVTPDHLDRYGSMDDYRDAKARITMNQSSGDFLVLNADDLECMRIYEALRERDTAPSIYLFSRRQRTEGVYLDGNRVMYDLGPAGNGTLIRADEILIPGVHNLENAMAASALAMLGGCSSGTVAKVLREFKGLPHRLELIREIDRVKYVNDSKGTNVGAVVKSLESFDGPVVLIAGGRDKDSDFSPLVPLVKQKVKALILIGEAAGKIHTVLGSHTRWYFEESLKTAVKKAREISSEGDSVLLSPACASFDMFENFEQRGERFREAVQAL